MKDDPTPTLPLPGEGVKPQSSPPVSGEDVKAEAHDVRTVIDDKQNGAEVEQRQNNTPPPDKGEAGRGSKHPRLHNLKSQLNNRRNNRKNPTEPEKRFWSWIRGKQLGCKFRRQHGIGKYIVDFYCAEHALIIELDGESHYLPEAIAYDQERTDFLMAMGFTVLRFTNVEIMQNKEGVLRAILPYLENRGDHEENI